MLGGRLLETENKRTYQISCLKSGRGRLRNLSSGRLRAKTVFWLRKRLFTKRSLTGGGRLREVVAMKELTVLHHISVTQLRHADWNDSQIYQWFFISPVLLTIFICRTNTNWRQLSLLVIYLFTLRIRC